MKAPVLHISHYQKVSHSFVFADLSREAVPGPNQNLKADPQVDRDPALDPDRNPKVDLDRNPKVGLDRSLKVGQDRDLKVGRDQNPSPNRNLDLGRDPSPEVVPNLDPDLGVNRTATNVDYRKTTLYTVLILFDLSMINTYAIDRLRYLPDIVSNKIYKTYCLSLFVNIKIVEKDFVAVYP